jgi:hypothetical protein
MCSRFRVHTGLTFYTHILVEPYGRRLVMPVENDSDSLLFSLKRDPPTRVIESIRGERLGDAGGGSRLSAGLSIRKLLIT